MEIREYKGIVDVSRFWEAQSAVQEGWWEDQPLLRADDQSTILLRFKNIPDTGPFSRGSYTIRAAINDRDVEVEGYSEVGKPVKMFVMTQLDRREFAREFSQLQEQVSICIASENCDEAALLHAATWFLVAPNEGDIDRIRLLSNVTSSSANQLTLHLDLVRSLLKQRQALSPEFGEKRRRDALNEELAALERRIDHMLNSAAQYALSAVGDAGAFARDAAELLLSRKESVQRSLDEAADVDSQLEELEKKISQQLTWLATNLRQESARSSVKMDEILESLLFDVAEGQVSLAEQGARPGDIVKIYLVHDPGPPLYVQSSAGATAQKQYTIARIEVQDFDWRTDITDSFLLIKRINDSDSDDEDRSSSNFKGAGGVSLFFSKDARPHKAWLLRSLDPSLGVNLSYLDFSNVKEIELGVAAILGLFRNQVQIGYGLNLNVTEDRDYFFVGLSFAKIKENMGGTNRSEGE
ncbi:MAG: hypothetical protein KY459_11995 [Acidobacteria bacterium]|nr:hypothetical protein [Acidobacteriota bacterium]